MIDPNDDDALLARLGRWLHDARAEAEALDGEGEVPLEAEGPEFGLYRLVEEFTALRHEIKLQTKGTRSLQEQAEALLPPLERAIEAFRAVVPKEDQAAFAAARPLAEALADLDEALDRGRSEIEKARGRLVNHSEGVVTELDALHASQSWFRRRWLRPYHAQVRAIAARSGRETLPAIINALLEGYDLIRDRLRRTMVAEQIRRTEGPGHPVDPGLMTVIEVVDAPGHAPGFVVDEVRRGYTWRGRLLRFAEVRAARSTGLAADLDLGLDTPEDGTTDGNDHRN